VLLHTDIMFSVVMLLLFLPCAESVVNCCTALCVESCVESEWSVGQGHLGPVSRS